MPCQSQVHTRSSKATAPGKGDIVTCRFPYGANTSIADCKVRTCLVVGCYRVGGRDYCAVAYGTSLDNKSNFGISIVVSYPDDTRIASLKKPTRFVLGRMRILPLDRKYFPPGRFRGTPSGASPIT
jgi:hypothetical protein